MITSFYVGPVWVAEVADKLEESGVKIFQVGTQHVWVDSEDLDTNTRRVKDKVLSRLYARFGSIFGLRNDGRRC
jgi:hypothetical protein